MPDLQICTQCYEEVEFDDQLYGVCLDCRGEDE